MGLEEIPTYLAEYLGVTVETAQVLLSIIVFVAVLLPVMIVAKGKYPMAVFMAAQLTLLFLVGVQWLAFWVLTLDIVGICAGAAILGANMIFGNK